MAMPNTGCDRSSADKCPTGREGFGMPAAFWDVLFASLHSRDKDNSHTHSHSPSRSGSVILVPTHTVHITLPSSWQ
ncbi:hypothetical protein SODALDRAFT_330296 [Sodiomyces alkalinus F11]|uniref:Uncharacterized protein n=1 Tax=Sodiomyces alkalinus (strain CBS 110278 / VKM F-3762 / F11) TaxID=1314773 RepID=A0A3N2Q1H9_SODAK|nr:hypothetical protein SODALDRAFT_330296 [Sodiomyces alkalinus F11]ROT40566.1 hypothetical protein SODALDRAFT_330296 [Sodiomyces alkalinus F11]